MDIPISSLLLGGEVVFLTHSSEFHGSKLDQEVRTDAGVHSQHVRKTEPQTIAALDRQ